MSAPHRSRQPRLRRSVEEAMRRRLSGQAASGKAPSTGELFPDELDSAIEQALSKLGTLPSPATGR